VSNEDYSLQQEAKKLGAAGYLGKPILIEDIFKIIDGL
jgi:ActR/RegA family two-component response regulator